MSRQNEAADPMDELYTLVVHALDGEEIKEIRAGFGDNQIVLDAWKVRACEEWIGDAIRGRVTAPQAVAISLYATEATLTDHEAIACASWGRELRKAAATGEVPARDPITWLPLADVPEGWDWILSAADLDAFAKSRGMGWTFTEIIQLMYDEIHTQPQIATGAPSRVDTVAPTAGGDAISNNTNGTAKLWTPERVAEARAMQSKLKGEGNKAFAAMTAAHYGVSTTRLRAALKEGEPGTKVTRQEKAGPWDMLRT